MKFMVSWRVNQAEWLPILKKWSTMPDDERTELGDGLTLIGRWHDLAGRRGVAIVDATDLGAVERYLGRWNPFMDLEMVPVLDDLESAQVASGIIADHGV